MKKEDLKKVINSITKEEMDREIKHLHTNTDETIKELEKVFRTMSDNDKNQGIKKFGSAEKLKNAILYYFALKANLVKKGIGVGIAAGASAAVLFETSSLCHHVASATECIAMDDIADGIETAGNFALDIASLGLSPAASYWDDFSDICSSFFSMVWGD